MFSTKNNKINDLLEMARLLNYLETAESKVEKVMEIKAALANGLIDSELAVDLVIEFC